MLNNIFRHFPMLLALVFSSQAFALSLADDFTQAVVNDSPTAFAATPSIGSGLDWKSLGYACLTAGTAANNQATTVGAANYSNIPGCNYGSPDVAGSGALRLTPATRDQAGAIVSGQTFPSNQGLQVTFTTYTYGGTGADGIGFFLQDGSVGTTLPYVGGTPGTVAGNVAGTISTGLTNIGESGGSLGYSCSNYKNVNWNGLTGAYLGLGMDEYGNFLNSVGDNTATGRGASSNTIGLRGAGNVSWYWLHTNYPTLYPGTVGVTATAPGQRTAVVNTCKTGFLWNYSAAAIGGKPSGTSMGVNSYAVDTNKVLLDYPAIPGGSLVLPSSTRISNGTTRANSKPVTYRLIITPSGLLSFMYSYNGGAYNSVLTNFPITTSNGPLPSTLRFGFAGSTGGSTNVHEISCFVAEPIQSTSSIGANTVQSGQVRTGTQVYLASYNPNGWMGSLVSDAIVNTAGTLSVSSVSNWDANCVLTGGACPNTGVAITTAEAPTYSTTSRQLLTWNGSAGVPLEWANLTSAQQTVLSPDSTTMGQYRLNWLRGDRSQEQTLAGPLRTRGGVLGDIVDSSPLWVGPPSAGYVSPFKDSLYVSTGSETSYATYSSSMATRMNVVYAGSNDGLLHGFRTGSNNTDGTYNSTNNDGYEVIGFMPSTVLADSNVVSLTSPTYGHSYFVDAPPGTGDLFYNGAWHTWLVGGIGPGGAEIFALDVTDPTGSVTATSAFKETNSANLVMGDWTSASLTTLTCVHAVTNCGNNLFDTYGTPLIRRLHNGKWAIIFGNGLPVSIAGLAWSGNVLTVTTSSNHGYAVGSTVTIGGGVTDSNSIPVNGSRTITSVPTPTTFTVALTSNPGTFSNVSSGVTALTSNSNHAGVFIGLISSTTGAVSSFYWLDTGIGSDSSPDGIAYVSSADLDGDRVTDYLYAGDLLGNVWRFDLTSSNPADWGVSNFGHTSATPLFVAKDSGGTAQPITTKIAVTGTTTGNKLRVILGFGTGLATPFTTASGVTYASGQQTVYGIWDWDMTQWNNGTTTTSSVIIPASTAQYASLAEVRSTGPTAYQTTLLTRTNLLANTDTQTATTRTMATSNVSWCGSSTCSSPNNQYGWYFDLPDTVASTSCGGTTCYEQIIYSPVFSGGDLLINSTISATATVAQCTPSLPTGWTMAFNMASGGGFVQNVFPDTTGSLTVTTGNNSIVGLKLSGVGTPYVVSVGSKQYVVNPNSGGGVNMKQINTQNGVTVKRISWTELR